MAKRLPSVICFVCHKALEYETVDAGGYDVKYVKPCEHCAAQHNVQADGDWVCKKCGTPNHDVRNNCRICGYIRLR